VSQWAFFAAFVDDQRIGGATIACRTPALRLLENRDDVALLLDLRVAPAYRRRGAGSALLSAACTWASANGYRVLKIETQNINTPACRFYASHACELTAVDPHAYAGLPEEIQLIWTRTLVPERRGSDKGPAGMPPGPVDGSASI
jgi:GNAT superfamily N-acetyltransferase